MAEVDFSDLTQAKAWFESQSIETCAAMASRAALRVFANFRADMGGAPDRLDLGLLRAILTSAGRGLGRPADVDWDSAALSAAHSALSASNSANSALSAAQSAANSALSAQSAAQSAALSAANSALSAALSARSAANSAQSAATADAQAVDHLFSLPLWPDQKAPETIQANQTALITAMKADPSWEFWLRFYEGMWKGTFDEWDLALKVIQIPDDDWDEGVAHIAEVIARFEAQMLMSKLPQVEEVFQAPNGLYDVQATVIDPSSLIESVANRVRFTFDLAITNNSCDLDDFATAAKILRHALNSCLDDPNALEQFLRQAADLITADLKRGGLTPHDTLDVLVSTLKEVALQLRADHPEVAAAVKSRTKQAVGELSDAKRLEGAERIEGLKDAGTTGRLHDEMGLAIDTVKDGSSDEATADALKQAGNRAAKISLAEKAKKAEGSGPMAALKIAMRADSVVDFVMRIISGGGG